MDADSALMTGLMQLSVNVIALCLGSSADLSTICLMEFAKTAMEKKA